MLTCQRHESETKQHPPKNHRWASPFSSLVRFKTDNFHLCFFIKKRTNTNFNLHDKQTVNGLSKIAWASVSF
jgi:hypothetical protein